MLRNLNTFLLFSTAAILAACANVPVNYNSFYQIHKTPDSIMVHMRYWDHAESGWDSQRLFEDFNTALAYVGVDLPKSKLELLAPVAPPCSLVINEVTGTRRCDNLPYKGNPNTQLVNLLSLRKDRLIFDFLTSLANDQVRVGFPKEPSSKYDISFIFVAHDSSTVELSNCSW